MVSINYSAREVCCKIVYYGPGLSGKTTNLQYVHSKVPQDTRGKLISLATEADRTLYFDFLPINIGTINGFQAKFQLYTVPGQVYYNATRKLVLRGCDGVVFVADSQPDKMDENLESLANLEENLREYGYDPDTMPLVIQYNKQDLPGVLSTADLNVRLNPQGRPTFEASATVGNGVFDTLKMIIKIVLEKAKATGEAPSAKAQRPIATAAPVATPAPTEAAYPAAAPEEERVPVTAVAAPPEPAPVSVPDAGQMAATAVEVAAAPATATAHRPYPGSTGSIDRKAVPVGFGQPEPEVAVETPPAPTAEAEVEAEVPPEPKEESRSGASPQMAPSLRRRGEPKKRGFFKRLFGIK